MDTSERTFERGTSPPAQDITISRRDSFLNSHLLQEIHAERGYLTLRAGLERGGVRNYDQRYVTVRRDLSDEGTARSARVLKLRPSRLDILIEALTELQDALEEGGLRIPSCVYCGDSLNSVDEAKEHTEGAHDERLPAAEFHPEWYQPDPDGEVSRLRGEDADV